MMVILQYGFLCCLICFYTRCFAQGGKIEDKIDPVFRVLIAKQKTGKISHSKKGFQKKKTKTNKEIASFNTQHEKKYDCIVYTKNGEALREKGIIINSELPSFVTAMVTLKQILQMAAMPDVTYIEFPAIMESH